MTRLTRLALAVAVALAATRAGLLTHQDLSPAPSTSAADSAAGRLLALTLPDGAGTPQSLKQWQGKVLVVNFWATWCPPCRREIPEFAAASEKYRARGVQFVGISVDSAENVARFRARTEVPYPLLIASPQLIALTEALGNASQGLPFTVIYDRHGGIALVKLGGLAAAELDAALSTLSAS